jgi:hypothetical protein
LEISTDLAASSTRLPTLPVALLNVSQDLHQESSNSLSNIKNVPETTFSTIAGTLGTSEIESFTLNTVMQAISSSIASSSGDSSGQATEDPLQKISQKFEHESSHNMLVIDMPPETSLKTILESIEETTETPVNLDRTETPRISHVELDTEIYDFEKSTVSDIDNSFDILSEDSLKNILHANRTHITKESKEGLNNKEDINKTLSETTELIEADDWPMNASLTDSVTIANNTYTWEEENSSDQIRKNTLQKITSPVPPRIKLSDKMSDLNGFANISDSVTNTNSSEKTSLNDTFSDPSKLDSDIFWTDTPSDFVQTNMHEASSISSWFPPITTTNTPVPGRSNISEIIIDTLAKLFVKTVDLSIKIQGAIVSNNKIGGKRKEFQIKSKVDTPEFDKNQNKITTLIKITADDAIETENFDKNNISEEDALQPSQPVVIIYKQSGNIFVNISDDMVIELDLSNLPSDAERRETVIRERVRNLIDKIFLEPQSEEEVSNKNLSDEIIKNITKIVLSKMEESFDSTGSNIIAGDVASHLRRTGNKSESLDFMFQGSEKKSNETAGIQWTEEETYTDNSALDATTDFSTTLYSAASGKHLIIIS